MFSEAWERHYGKVRQTKMLWRNALLYGHEETGQHGESDSSRALPDAITASVASDPPPPSCPYSGLHEIAVEDLEVGKRHLGRVLFGKLCAVTAFKDSCVNTVLEDYEERGSAVSIIIYNSLPSSATPGEVQCKYPVGTNVAIKKPYLIKVCGDGGLAVCEDDPADFVFWDGQVVASQDPAHTKSLTELNFLRAAGNRLFLQEKWIEAIKKYSECITDGVRSTDKNGADRIIMESYLMVVYSNRSEAYLRLQQFEEALRDAEAALEVDSDHLKSLMRMGKAMHGLAQYENACLAFTRALEQFPQDQIINGSLNSSLRCVAQSRDGIYDLSAYVRSGFKGPTSDFCDYIGPVEVRRVAYAGGRRGLFATQDVKKGCLLLVSNPLATAYSKLDLSNLLRDLQLGRRISKRGHIRTGTEQDLIAEVTKQVMTSKRRLAQLYSLMTDDEKAMDVPHMQLFKPGSVWIPDEATRLEVDIGRICKIVACNAFGSNTERSLVDLRKRAGLEDTFMAEPHLVPSFMNHSCSPSCIGLTVGRTCFIRAGSGEELTISYFDVLCTLDSRQSLSKEWNFACNCERCVFEGKYYHYLSRFNEAFQAVTKRAQSKGLKVDKLVTVRELSWFVVPVEELIQKQGFAEWNHISWLRASFSQAYVADYNLQHKSAFKPYKYHSGHAFFCSNSHGCLPICLAADGRFRTPISKEQQ